LPTHEEFEPVRSIEDALEKLATETSSWYVGRVTVAGHRDFFVYSWHAAARWQPFVSALAAQTGYELEVSVRDDPQHAGYWHDLYPTDDDWRVIHDLEVLDQLRKRGDDGHAERQIDHWVYFDNEKAATEFVTWAEAESFTHDTKYSRLTDEGTYCVRLHHIGPATIEVGQPAQHRPAAQSAGARRQIRRLGNTGRHGISLSTCKEFLPMIQQFVDTVQHEIAEEKADALGRAGRRLQHALERFRELEGRSASREPTLVKREQLLWELAERTESLIVQREACGLRDARYVLAFYGVPHEAIVRVGAKRPAAH
jgi:hypothetical protein